MNKSIYLLGAAILIALLAVGDAFSRGFRGGGGRGGGHRGGGMSYRGGGASHRSPSMGHQSHRTRSYSSQKSRSSYKRSSHTSSAKKRHTSKPRKTASPSKRTSTKKRPAAKPHKAARPSKPSRQQLQGFLDMPKGKPGSGRGDMAKIAGGAAMGALGMEGARKLLESRPASPGERPAGGQRPARPERPVAKPPTAPGGPERPARPEQPIARPPGKPGKPGKPERPGRPDQPIARPPDKPGRPERPKPPIARPPGKPGKPGRPEHPIARPPHKPGRPGHPRPPVARPPYHPGRPGYPGHRPGYGWGNHWWRHATWGLATGWIVGASFGEPYYYNYDSGIYYEGDVVYMDGEQIATAEEYYDQANQLATAAPQTQEMEEEDWLPLGIFSISAAGSSESTTVLQLAVNKQGVIQGTYYNTATGSERPLKGMVDKKTQRAAWTFADGYDTDIIMETGLYNLTKNETEALVHFGKDQTQKARLVRLEQPAESKKK